MCETIDKKLKTGMARSVNDALRQLNKHRKTVDRFKHIYYLTKSNRNLFNDVSWSTVL